MTHSSVQAGPTVDAVIVGAGFSGIGQLHALRTLGLECRVFETGEDVGGTWYWNRYPGCRVDVESHWYSYSFSPELDQEWTWSEKLPTRQEILTYLEHVVGRFDLRRDITCGVRVTGAEWHEERNGWTVETDTGLTVSARFLIMATGNLSAVKGLEIPGVEQFVGEIYHTGSWPAGGVNFTGKRVGVVGTGSSGIQVIPLIARQAAALTVFQRTANFAFPARNRLLDTDEVVRIKAAYPDWRAQQRRTYLGIPDAPPERGALEVSEAERLARYEEGWERGGLNALLIAYNDLFISDEANETLAEFVRGKIRSVVDDPAVAEDLCPRGYPIGAKRACLQTDYYETYNCENVELVNLRRTPLIEYTPRGLRTTDAEYELDAIILATGFDAITGSVMAVDIRGRDGQPLREVWAAGPRSYLGLAVAGFPNLFTITGPGSPSVISNMAFSIQEHINWIAAAIRDMDAQGVAAIEASYEAQDAWVAHVQELAAMTLFPKADSYYNGANVPGKPHVFSIYTAGVAEYRRELDDVVDHGYHGFTRVRAATNQPTASQKVTR